MTNRKNHASLPRAHLPRLPSSKRRARYPLLYTRTSSSCSSSKGLEISVHFSVPFPAPTTRPIARVTGDHPPLGSAERLPEQSPREEADSGGARRQPPALGSLEVLFAPVKRKPVSVHPSVGVARAREREAEREESSRRKLGGNNNYRLWGKNPPKKGQLKAG